MTFTKKKKYIFYLPTLDQTKRIYAKSEVDAILQLIEKYRANESDIMDYQIIERPTQQSKSTLLVRKNS